MKVKTVIACFALLAVGLLLSLSVGAAADSPAGKPWVVRGKVTDVNGKPIEGAKISAHCGVGTLFPTGEVMSGVDGVYELHFGPGMRSLEPQGVPLQAATIQVSKQGYYETNLYRHGGLMMADVLPQGDTVWGKTEPEHICLPEKPMTLNFVLAPAGSLKGQVLDKAGNPLAGKRLVLGGNDLPPSRNVLQSITTDSAGKFEFIDVPTGFLFKLYLETGGSRQEPPDTWIKLEQPVARKVEIRLRDDHLEVSDQK